jgi:DNA-binding FrmR family transcriptional regulator
MDPLQQRIRSVRGHLRGIARLIERDAADLEAVRQIRAVQAALHAIRLLLLRRHLAPVINNLDLASADPDAPALLELRALLISFLPSSASRSRPGLSPCTDRPQ